MPVAPSESALYAMVVLAKEIGEDTILILESAIMPDWGVRYSCEGPASRCDCAWGGAEERSAGEHVGENHGGEEKRNRE